MPPLPPPLRPAPPLPPPLPLEEVAEVVVEAADVLVVSPVAVVVISGGGEGDGVTAPGAGGDETEDGAGSGVLIATFSSPP